MPFLHAPIRTFEEVADLINTGATEKQHLELKGAFWVDSKDGRVPAAEEAMKDVAALGNAEGGTIVVGVAEGPPLRWCSLAPAGDTRTAAGLEQSVGAWLNTHLSPRDFARTVEVAIVSGTDGGGVQREALLVNVPACPNGAVVVETTRAKRNDRLYLLAPIRVGKEVKYMDFDGTLARCEPTRRGRYVELRELSAGLKSPRVSFASRVLVPVDRKWFPLPLKEGAHATLDSIAPSHFTLAMDGFNDKAAEREATGQQYMTPGEFQNAVDHPAGIKLAVPYDLVEAMWRDANDAVIHVALRATVCWEGSNHWLLRVDSHQPVPLSEKFWGVY